MPTERQKKLAKALVDNMKSKVTKNGTELLVSTGYSEQTAKGGVKDIIGQKGVTEALEDLGFTAEKAKRVVGKILNSDTEDSNVRLKAADMTFKVHGTYAAEKHEVQVFTLEELFKNAKE